MLAVFLATAVSPVVDFQVLRCKIPHTPAIALALLLVVAFLAVLGLLLIISVQAIIATAGDYSNNFVELTKQIFTWMKQWKIEVDFAKITDELQHRMPVLISQAAGTGTSLIVNGFLITFFVIFLLAGRNSRRVRAAMHQQIESAVRRYIITKFAISLITGLLVWVTLAMLGLRMAFVFGLLTFLLNFIPSIGAVIATLLPLPLAVAQFDSFWLILGVVAIPGALQLLIGNVIEPKLLGRGLELHPVTVLLALAFWGLLWGYMGMVL
ncbi:MAG: AI-2E family transporter, partial [Thermoguttaceae bacterium]